MDGSNKEIKKDKKKKNIVEEIEDIESTKTQNKISTIKITASKDEHNTNITCQANHPTYPNPLDTVIHMNVEFKPEMTLSVVPEEIKEGDNVRLTCSTNANPDRVTFKWYIADILEHDRVRTINASTSSLQILGISKAMNNKKIKCWASNKVLSKNFESDSLHTLNVHCKY